MSGKRVKRGVQINVVILATSKTQEAFNSCGWTDVQHFNELN